MAMFGDGRLVHLPGGIDEYLARAAAAVAGAADLTPAAAAPAREGMSAAEVRTAKKELDRLERQIAKLEQQEADLHDQLAAHATDYAKVAELDAQLQGGAGRAGTHRGDLADAGRGAAGG